MPFRSAAQRRFMYKFHPEIAERWQRKEDSGEYKPSGATRSTTRTGADLPKVSAGPATRSTTRGDKDYQGVGSQGKGRGREMGRGLGARGGPPGQSRPVLRGNNLSKKNAPNDTEERKGAALRLLKKRRRRVLALAKRQRG